MKDTITCYRTVYDRHSPIEVYTYAYFNNPICIYTLWNEYTVQQAISMLDELKTITDKEYRNKVKRQLLPVATFFDAGFMTFDIDNINNHPSVKEDLIKTIKQDKQVYCLQESVSGNLVIYYKFDCEKRMFKYAYYKKYLELTLNLGVSIDYLPEPDRNRYISNGEVYLLNVDAEPIKEVLIVDKFLIPNKIENESQCHDSENKEYTLLDSLMANKVFKS